MLGDRRSECEAPNSALKRSKPAAYSQFRLSCSGLLELLESPRQKPPDPVGPFDLPIREVCVPPASVSGYRI